MVLDFPISKRKRREAKEQEEYALRVALSSAVREVSPEEFDRIAREHEEFLLAKACLARFDEF